MRTANSSSINDVTASSISLSEMQAFFARSATDLLPSTNCLKTAMTVGLEKILARFDISVSDALDRKLSILPRQNATRLFWSPEE